MTAPHEITSLEADAPKYVSSQIGNSRVRHSNETCESGLSAAQENALNAQLSASFAKFLAGGLSMDQVNSQLQEILSREGSSLTPKNQAAFERAQAQIALGSFRAKLLTKRLAGEVITPSEYSILEKLGVPRAVFEKNLTDEASRLQESFDLLRQTGFTYSSAKGWGTTNRVAPLEPSDVEIPALPVRPQFILRSRNWPSHLQSSSQFCAGHWRSGHYPPYDLTMPPVGTMCSS